MRNCIRPIRSPYVWPPSNSVSGYAPDRLLLLGAVAHALLTLLGAAGERCGLDRKLRTNTSKKRQLSLYRQGSFWYEALPNMIPERLALLMSAYDEVLREHAFFREIFGII